MSHKCSSGLLAIATLVACLLLICSLSQLLHPPFELCMSQVPSRAPSARLALRFTCQHTSQAQMSHKCLSGTLSPLHHPCCLLTTSLQAQTSHNCSSGLFLNFFVLSLNFTGHMYPDKLQVLIWLFFSPANHTSQAQMSFKCLSGLPLPQAI
jgi:hypothetical protein